jgi:hypothetical protein
MAKQRQVGDYASEIESKYGTLYSKAFREEIKYYYPDATEHTFIDVYNLESFMQYAFEKLSA